MGNHGPLNGYEIMIIKKDESPSHNYYLSFPQRFIQDEKINRSFSFKAIDISKGELLNRAVMNTISLFFKETFPFWIFKNEMENLSYEINTYIVCVMMCDAQSWSQVQQFIITMTGMCLSFLKNL